MEPDCEHLVFSTKTRPGFVVFVRKIAALLRSGQRFVAFVARQLRLEQKKSVGKGQALLYEFRIMDEKRASSNRDRMSAQRERHL